MMLNICTVGCVTVMHVVRIYATTNVCLCWNLLCCLLITLSRLLEALAWTSVEDLITYHLLYA